MYVCFSHAASWMKHIRKSINTFKTRRQPSVLRYIEELFSRRSVQVNGTDICKSIQYEDTQSTIREQI